jgi:nitrate/nitrite-specific signal transduction histidine kinase
MEERAAILHATFELHSRPGHGTVIELVIPAPPTHDSLPQSATKLANADSVL